MFDGSRGNYIAIRDTDEGWRVQGQQARDSLTCCLVGRSFSSRNQRFDSGRK